MRSKLAVGVAAVAVATGIGTAPAWAAGTTTKPAKTTTHSARSASRETGWEVVLGSFRARAAADKLATKATSKGMTVTVESEHGRYEVAANGYATARSAAKALAKDRRNGFKNAHVERA